MKIPSHWWLDGPQIRRTGNLDVFRWRNVAGGHVASWRRLIRIGPFGFYMIRYAPGRVDKQPAPELIP